MATIEIKYILNGQLTGHALSKDDKSDKILTLVSAGSADKQRVISEIMEMNPGLERETVEAVINFEQRAVQKLVLTGFHVNMGLYQVTAQFTGIIENKAWNPERNTVYASFTQGSGMRGAIRRTGVSIIGEKGSAMYVAGTQDTATRATNATATAGRNFTLTGAKIKVLGTDPSVGITLTSDATRTVTKIPEDMWAVNDPSRLIFLIPADMEDGVYTLRVTTQYTSSGKKLLKVPRTVEQIITLGGGGGSGDVEDPTV